MRHAVLCLVVSFGLMGCDRIRTVTSPPPTLGFETDRRAYGFGRNDRRVIDLDRLSIKELTTDDHKAFDEMIAE